MLCKFFNHNSLVNLLLTCLSIINPKSSSLAAMSIIDETKKFIDNFEINM